MVPFIGDAAWPSGIGNYILNAFLNDFTFYLPLWSFW